nr:hypothetical protein CFP56_08284 [Quercus suber]
MDLDRTIGGASSLDGDEGACEECGDNLESVLHLFLECPKARETWALFRNFHELATVQFSSSWGFEEEWEAVDSMVYSLLGGVLGGCGSSGEALSESGFLIGLSKKFRYSLGAIEVEEKAFESGLVFLNDMEGTLLISFKLFMKIHMLLL